MKMAFLKCRSRFRELVLGLVVASALAQCSYAPGGSQPRVRMGMMLPGVLLRLSIVFRFKVADKIIILRD